MLSLEQEQDLMLASIGIASVNDLFSQVPPEVKMARKLAIPERKPDWEMEKKLKTLAKQNVTTLDYISFLGGGFYEHYIPPVVDALANRGEFLTAYTPYQPEMSQGLLQIFSEYQAYIRLLTGLPICNISSYDGATALSEAVWMALRGGSQTRKDGVCYADQIWPETLSVLETYCWGKNISLTKASLQAQDGAIDLEKLESFLKETDVRAFAFQTPNRFGVTESVQKIADLCKKYGVISILYYYPLLSGLFRTPGELGVDIVAGEAQCLGLPLSMGGPGLGLLACDKKFAPFLTGRVVGQVKDQDGQDAFAFINEEREQHFSRDKANSNICTNQAHCVIRVAIYLSVLGGNGFLRLSQQNYYNAHFFMSQVIKIPGISRLFSGPFFNEFTLSLSFSAKEFLKRLRDCEIFGGIDVSTGEQDQRVLVTVTEVKNKDELAKALLIFEKCARGMFDVKK
jgi:glycine dehydrogenase subunit 1